MANMKINKKLLPVKGHYFLFNAGTAPLVPYLTTYARQLGFTSATVGLIYTILPIFGLVAKPFFGVIADKYKSQKTLFIIFQIVTIISFSAIYFIPREVSKTSIEMDCGDKASVIKSCYPESGDIDHCKISDISKNINTTCKMNCNMTSPSMWQTVCEHWHMPMYCYRMVKKIKYTAMINNVTNTSNCLSISTHTVKLDDLMYESRCRGAKPEVIMNELCTLDCNDPSLTALINKNIVNMTCIDGIIDFRLCNYDDVAIDNVMEKPNLGACEVYCNISSPFVLMELCESWNAGVASSCRTRNPEALPDKLPFDATFSLSKMEVENNCIYIEMDYIRTIDGIKRIPYCGPKAYYEHWPNEFKSACDIDCDNKQLNDLIKSATGEKKAGTEYNEQFWMFFFMMIISWIGQAVVVTFADAICFNTLGARISQYGKQRLWGSVGWGIFSLLTGTLIDIMSEGAYKDYTIAFILMFVFMLGDVIVSCFIKVDMTKISINIVADVRTLLSSPPTVVFLFWTIAVGLCTGLMWQFLFWHIEDVAGQVCDGTNYVKTLQGLVSAIQTFGGEIPFMFVSGYLLKRFGHNTMMTLVLFAFGIRLILYSYLTNAWWILPIELFQGLTSGMFYPTMTSYANVVAPPGTETTVQGLVGAVFEGIGSSLGSFIGGRLYGIYGGWITFRWFGYGALVACALHAIAMLFFKTKPHLALTQELSTVVHYRNETGDTAVQVLVDEMEGTSQNFN